jgi:hypothetical protein
MKMHLDEVNPRALPSTLTSTSPSWGFRSPALQVSIPQRQRYQHKQRTHLRRIRNHALIDQVRASLSNTGHLRSAWV